jgi:hypothetical protein
MRWGGTNLIRGGGLGSDQADYLTLKDKYSKKAYFHALYGHFQHQNLADKHYKGSRNSNTSSSKTFKTVYK